MAASGSKTPETEAEAALAAMRRGNLLTAYDITERGLRDAPDDLELIALSRPRDQSGPVSCCAQPTPMRCCSTQAVIPIQVSMRLRCYFGPVTGKGPLL